MMQDYILLAGANQISVVPTGIVLLSGLHGESPYLRGLLNKIGVTPDFLTCGKYKSAAEIFMREGPSPQAEEMTNWLLDSIFDTSIKLIARGRGVDTEKVRKWIDVGTVHLRDGPRGRPDRRRATAAGIRGRREAAIRRQHEICLPLWRQGPTQARSLVTDGDPQLLRRTAWRGKKAKSDKDSIAIVYVEGPIVLGSSESSILNPGGGAAASTPIRKALDKVAADHKIKAVVLRVNSPGGSATASEIILDATKRVKAKKPLVVSMGDVAGSGGYYVACGADTIFADESTITGSIGVVGGKLATTEMWNNVGITWKEYNRGANATLLSSARPFTPEQRKTLQGWMDEIYGVFKGHVTAIRGDRLKKPIDELAGGRVYTGRQALDLGLVDKIGTLEDAIKFVAAEAKIEKYEVRVVPEPKSLFERLLAEGNGDDDETELITGSVAASLQQPSLFRRRAAVSSRPRSAANANH